MSQAEIRQKISQLEAAVSSKSPDASSLLIDIKIALTQLPALQPGVVITEALLPEIALARDAYEIAALLSVAEEDEVGFERHVSQAKTYYVDYASVLPASPRQSLILGLNLVRLMAQNRIAEFHTELELVPSATRADAMIDYALRLEHYLMEGSYSKMRDEQQASRMPHPAFACFVQRLMVTVREEIAACCEHAYERLESSAAAQMLSLQTAEDLEDFCAERKWNIVDDVEGKGGQRFIVFGKKEEKINKMEQVPSELLIKRSLQYARELEQII